MLSLKEFRDQIEEGKDGYGVPSHTHSHVMKKIKNGEWEAMQDVEKGKHIEIRDTNTGKRKMIHVKEDVESVEEAAQDTLPKHKVIVTVSEPDHPSVSKRKEQVMKRVVVSALGRDDAKAKAEEFYKKKGYKVHDSEYHSKMPGATLKTEEVVSEAPVKPRSDKEMKSPETLALKYSMYSKETLQDLHAKGDFRAKNELKRRQQNEETELEEGAFENLPGKATHIANKDIKVGSEVGTKDVIQNGTVLRHLGKGKYEVRAGRLKGKHIDLHADHVNKLSEETDDYTVNSNGDVHHKGKHIGSIHTGKYQHVAYYHPKSIYDPETKTLDHTKSKDHSHTAGLAWIKSQHQQNEEFDLEEKTLTPAELKKREEIAKAMHKQNPDMPMGKKMAIATSIAKKVAEDTVQIDELSKSTRDSYIDKATKDAHEYAKAANNERSIARSRDSMRKKPEDPGWNERMKKKDLAAADKYTDRVNKRLAGIAMAISKESVEGVVEGYREDHDKAVDASDAAWNRGGDHKKAISAIKKAIKSHKDAVMAATWDGYDEAEKHHLGKIQSLNKLMDQHKKVIKEESMNAPLTYSQFLEWMQEHKIEVVEGKIDDLRDRQRLDKDLDDWGSEKDEKKTSGARKVKGRAYGSQDDEPEDDEEQTSKPTEVKRGRGRPAGSKSGARRHK